LVEKPFVASLENLKVTLFAENNDGYEEYEYLEDETGWHCQL
jgi:hypothetical protein